MLQSFQILESVSLTIELLRFNITLYLPESLSILCHCMESSRQLILSSPILGEKREITESDHGESVLYARVVVFRAGWVKDLEGERTNRIH